MVIETLLDQRARSRGQFRHDAVKALVERGGLDGTKADQRLFCVFLLERWQRLFTDRDRRPSLNTPQLVGPRPTRLPSCRQDRVERLTVVP
jgi:hypothetical protein